MSDSTGQLPPSENLFAGPKLGLIEPEGIYRLKGISIISTKYRYWESDKHRFLAWAEVIEGNHKGIPTFFPFKFKLGFKILPNANIYKLAQFVFRKNPAELGYTLDTLPQLLEDLKRQFPGMIFDAFIKIVDKDSDGKPIPLDKRYSRIHSFIPVDEIENQQTPINKGRNRELGKGERVIRGKGVLK